MRSVKQDRLCLSNSINSTINEMARRRKYEMRRRADQVAGTRARIVEATVDLHREVGPARTTVAEIARRAGVERLTVYNHFPDERALFGACQAHWLAQAPPPDPSAHADVADPEARLEAVLLNLYGWYREREDMLRNVVRDAEVLPALAEALEVQRQHTERTVELLLEGRRLGAERRLRVSAVLALLLDFHTWDCLTRAGLDDAGAASAAAAMVGGI
jgi:AcrR family transcriptional regulator